MSRHFLVICSLLWSIVAAAQTGPFTLRTESITLVGHELRVDVYQPSVDVTPDVAIVAHGFTRSRARHRDLAVDLAGVGVTVVVPDLPYTADHWGNGDAIVELERALAAGALGLSPLDRSHLVLIGTSAGGLATVLAAAKLPGLAGWVGLDPVDRTFSGIHAAAQLTCPAVVLLAEPSTCNLFGSGRSIARAVPGLLRYTLIPGASHCDFESPTNKLCRVMCGESSFEKQTIAREATVRATLDILRGNGRRDPPQGRGGPPQPHPERQGGISRATAMDLFVSRDSGSLGLASE
jgi:pimeloyl-ACP methyl ester carboxylesterase